MADARSEPATSVWNLLIGRPRSARGTGKERITPVEGLSALSLDALTSVAYGPEAIILVLAVAGAGALHPVLPITIAIVALLAILVFSYRQVIDAYPMGGGAYAVSRANLGKHTSLVAAASLVVDYTLTVAVSIAAGVASLQSAFPSLDGATIPLCLAILAFITVLNLRGLGETARAFLLPTMVFIVGLLAIIAVGLIHPLGLNEAPLGTSQLPTSGLKAVTFLLVLKAFSAGCSALTGVEAIANGVPLFREPRTVRAKRTEMLLGVLLGAMLLGLAVLAKRWQIGPRSGQTVLSQIMAMSVGRGWAYYIVSITITIVLALAANTSFGGLPVLASLVARDNYLPHLFTIRGDRQTFANGIVVLALMAGALLVAVGGNTNTLIPLFAIGVFIGFTLSQTGSRGALVQDPPARVATPRRRQRGRRVHHRHRDGRLLDLEIHRGGLGGRDRHPRLHLPLPPHPRLLRPRGQGAGDRRDPAQARAEAHDRHRAGQPRLAPHRARPVRGRVPGAGRDRGDGRPPRWRRRRTRRREPPAPLAQVGSRRAAQGAPHRLRVSGRADPGLHRRAAGRAPRRSAGRAHPGHPARQAALPAPAQPARPRALERPAQPLRRGRRPGHHADPPRGHHDDPPEASTTPPGPEQSPRATPS